MPDNPIISKIKLPNNVEYQIKDDTLAANSGIEITSTTDNNFKTTRTITNTGVLSINNRTGNVTLTASDLGLDKPLNFVGIVTSSESNLSKTSIPTISNKENYTPQIGDVIIYSDSGNEYVCISIDESKNPKEYTWEQFGRNTSVVTQEQVNGNNSNNNYPLLFSPETTPNTIVDKTFKNNYLTYNPYTNNLSLERYDVLEGVSVYNPGTINGHSFGPAMEKDFIDYDDTLFPNGLNWIGEVYSIELNNGIYKMTENETPGTSSNIGDLVFLSSENSYYASINNGLIDGDNKWIKLVPKTVRPNSDKLITERTLYYYKGNENIDTVGNIIEGTWNGDTISVSRGGTGRTSFSKYHILYGNGTDAIQSGPLNWENWEPAANIGPKAVFKIGDNLTVDSNLKYTSPAIPTATEEQSGIVTAVTQHFGGNKFFTGGQLGIKTKNSNLNKIVFGTQPTPDAPEIDYYTSDTNEWASINVKIPSETTGSNRDYFIPQFSFKQYGFSTTYDENEKPSYTRSEYYEEYLLPEVKIDLTNNKTYTILTSKGTLNGALYVTSDNAEPQWGTLPIAQGGTGATTKPTARTNLEVPYIGGDTFTGNISLKTNYNASLANNGISSGIGYPTTFNILDSSERIMVRNEAVINSNGSIGSYWYVRNYNTESVLAAQKGIGMYMAKDGTLTYEVSDSDKFRSAIGLGTIATYDIVGTTNTSGFSSTKILIPRILTDGVMEVGKYIDFHVNADSTNDYDVRITASTTGVILDGTTSGTFSGNLTGNVTGDCSGSSGSCTGNAATATKATQDGSGNTITSKYLTIDTAQTITGTKSWGANGAGGQLNGAATNGGINSICVGDDVWLGDCNAAGIMGMKSTSTKCGFYMYNSGGTQIGQLYFDGTNLVCNKNINANILGNANNATYLANRGGSTVSIGDSSWAIQITPSGHTNRATVFSQKWTQSGLTYIPSGGSATTITDTADIKFWLSSSNTSNSLQVNMQIDGRIYALGGFQGNLTGTVTGDCSGSSGSCTGNAATATSTPKLSLASTNTQSTSTNTYASGAFNIRWFANTGKLPGQPSQYGFLMTIATGDGSAENHQIWCTQSNGSLLHRGTNGSTYQSPPAFMTILDSSNYTTYCPTKTGSGASGTWGIDITGKAANVTGKVEIGNGGTGATNASGARSNLGIKSEPLNLSLTSDKNYDLGNNYAITSRTVIAVGCTSSTVAVVPYINNSHWWLAIRKLSDFTGPSTVTSVTVTITYIQL